MILNYNEQRDSKEKHKTYFFSPLKKNPSNEQTRLKRESERRGCETNTAILNKCAVTPATIQAFLCDPYFNFFSCLFLRTLVSKLKK